MAAAGNGDVILVRPHSVRYEFTFITGKALTIVGDGDVWPQVEGVLIRNLTSSQVVTLRFLDIEGRRDPSSFFTAVHPGVQLTSSDGLVWLEDLVCTGASGISKLGGSETGSPGLISNDSDHVVVVDSHLRGGDGFWSVGGSSYPGGDGGHLAFGQLAFHGCTFDGGIGGQAVISFPGQGVNHLPASAAWWVLAAGPAGAVDIVVRALRLPPGVEGSTAYAQPLVAETGGARRLGAPSAIVIVDGTITPPRSSREKPCRPAMLVKVSQVNALM